MATEQPTTYFRRPVPPVTETPTAPFVVGVVPLRNWIGQEFSAVQRSINALAGSGTGPIPYANLPVGSGVWDTGVGTTITVERNLTVVGTLTASITGTATALNPGNTINGVLFTGASPITVTAAAGTLTGTTLNATVVTSSLTSVGTLTSLHVSGGTTLDGTLTMTAAASTVIPGATSFVVNNHANTRANLTLFDAGALQLATSTGELLNVAVTAVNGDMPAGMLLSNSGTTAGHRALSLFPNDGSVTSGNTVGAYYFTNTNGVQTVWEYGNAVGVTSLRVFPKGGEVQFGSNFAGSSSNVARLRLYGTTTSSAGGTATLIVQQGGIATDTLLATSTVQFSHYGAGTAVFDASGNVTSAAAVPASSVPWSGVTGTPTTLAGYGITSPLDVAEGGTAIATYTIGDTLYASGSTTLSTLGIGAANTVLTSSGTAPQWSTSLTLAGSLTCATGGILVNQDAANQWDNTGSGRLLHTLAGSTSGPHHRLRSAQGTIAAPTASVLNNELGRYGFAGYDGANYIETARIVATAAQGFGVGTNGTQLIFSTTPNGSATATTALTLGQDQSATFGGTINGQTISSTASFTGTLTATGGLVRFNNVGIGVTGQLNDGLHVGGSYTASSGSASAILLNSTLIAAANSDSLAALNISPLFTPGAFTSLAPIGLVINGFSVAAFTTPADPIMLSFGNITGTGATNAYSIKLGAGPAGATNNYLIHATNFQLTSAGAATFAGASVFSSTLNVVGNFTVNTNKFTVTASTGAIAAAGSATITGGFGCNSASAQTAYASGGAVVTTTPALASYGYTLAQATAIITLLNNIRSALVANGIMS